MSAIMGNRAQRFGINIGRGWVILFLIAGSLLLGAYWIGPLRPIPARLQLLAIDGDRAVEQIAVEPGRAADGGIVFAIPVAVRNVGAQTARPSRVVLSVPPQFRVATPRGRIVGQASAGVPLRRYPIALPRDVLRPDSQTRTLSGLDTIYLELDLPRYYCATQGPQIPEFSSAPKYNAQTLSDIRIFYSFTDPSSRDRQTGLLRVQLDPALLDIAPAPNPPMFPTVIEAPEARAPDTGTLLFAGVRIAHCGDPELPVDLYTVLWETRAGGRLFVVYVDELVRKRLYDMDRDGIIELETWDTDGDGRFEARRDARYAVPEFLVPLPPRDPAMTQPDPVRPDSAWLALFHSPDRGPHRFAQSSLTPHPPVATADTIGDVAIADSAAAAELVTGTPERADADVGDVRPATPEFLALFADTAAGPFRFAPLRAPPAAARPDPDLGDVRADADLGYVRPATPEFLALFADTAAGPFRFAPRRPPPAAAQGPVMRATPGVTRAAPGTTPADSAAMAEEEPAPEPRPRRRRQPLGTPIGPPR
jgi:hypothetical protein